MAQNPLGPPPFIRQEAAFDRWMRLMWQRIVATGQVLWTQIISPTVVKNTFFSGPTNGADAQASFRAIVAADLGTGSASAGVCLLGNLTWGALTSSGFAATPNIISTPTTISADTSYIVIDYLNIEAAFNVEGMVEVL
jgi:hypothetical protein